MKTKLIVFALIFTFLAGTLLSCGGSSGNNATTAAGTQAGTALAASAGDTTVNYDPGLPATDFGGYGFRVLNINQADMWWAVINFDAPDQTGEVVNDAIYKRNREIEDKYNIKITETNIAAASMSAQIKKMVQSGTDDYDLFCPESTTINSLIGINAFYDFNKLPNVNLSQPWWNQSANKNYSIAGKLFFAVNDLLLTCDDDLAIIMYNKNIAQNLNIDSADQLYDTVLNGQWTLDKMTSLAKTAYSDVNGNGKPDYGDRFGMVTVSWSPDALVGATGEFIATKDANDLPVLACDTQRFTDVYNKVRDISADRTLSVVEGLAGSLPSGKLTQDVFQADQALMCIQVLSCVRLYKNMASDFAVLPLPKYDESQSDYYGYYLWATGLTVPSTAPDPSRTGFILEALAAAGMEYVHPAYYEYAMASKYMRDDKSFQMLDLIMKNPVTDISNEVYNWGSFQSTYVNSFFKADSNFTTLLAKYSDKINADMAKTVASYQAAG